MEMAVLRSSYLGSWVGGQSLDLCLGLIKIKSNQIHAVQHRRMKTEPYQCTNHRPVL